MLYGSQEPTQVHGDPTEEWQGEEERGKFAGAAANAGWIRSAKSDLQLMLVYGPDQRPARQNQVKHMEGDDDDDESIEARRRGWDSETP
jgi:hypothetical protein